MPVSTFTKDNIPNPSSTTAAVAVVSSQPTTTSESGMEMTRTETESSLSEEELKILNGNEPYTARNKRQDLYELDRTPDEIIKRRVYIAQNSVKRDTCLFMFHSCKRRGLLGKCAACRSENKEDFCKSLCCGMWFCEPCLDRFIDVYESDKNLKIKCPLCFSAKAKHTRDF